MSSTLPVCCVSRTSWTGEDRPVLSVYQISQKDDSFPFEDPTVVVRVKGGAILQALENGVCHYPALEGAFIVVSDINWEY